MTKIVYINKEQVRDNLIGFLLAVMAIISICMIWGNG